MANGLAVRHQIGELAEASKTQLVAIIQRNRGALATMRERISGTGALAQRAATVAAGGFILGKIAKNYSASAEGVPTVLGIDWQLLWAAAGMVGGHFLGGRWGELISDASTAGLAVYGYEAGQR